MYYFKLRLCNFIKVGFLIKFPCTNKIYGCKEQLPLNQKLMHESQCYYLLFQCFFINCQWKGKYFEINEHMTNIHSRRILKGPRQVQYYKSLFKKKHVYYQLF